MQGRQLEMMREDRQRHPIVTLFCRYRELLKQLVRYGITGVLNTAICLVILFMLHERYGVDEWIASFTGYAIATVHSFIVSKYWTFAGEQKAKAHSQFIAFVIVNAIGAVMFSTGVHLLSPLLGLRPGSVVSAAVVILYNFAASKLFVFRKAAA